MVSKFDHHVFSGGRSRVVSICQYPVQDETNLSFTSQAQGVSLTSSLVASVWFAHLMLGTFFGAPLKCGRASDGWSLWINTENIVAHIYIYVLYTYIILIYLYNFLYRFVLYVDYISYIYMCIV